MKVIFVLFCSVVVWAQQKKPAPTPDEKEIARLQGLADQVKKQLTIGNLAAANRFVEELGLVIQRREKSLKFAQLEASLPGAGQGRFEALAKVANAAYELSDYAKAEAYARELLTVAPEYLKDSNYGDAIFLGNTVLGRVALRRDKNVADAKAALLASGQTPGSPALGSFGPNMSLAKELLEVGEQEIVLQFFDQCRAFWHYELMRKRLDDWAATVKSCCRMPDFRANLVYGFE